MPLPLPYVVADNPDTGAPESEAVQGNFDELKKQFPLTSRHLASGSVTAAKLGTAVFGAWTSDSSGTGALFNFGANPEARSAAAEPYFSESGSAAVISIAGAYRVTFRGLTVVSPAAIARHDTLMYVNAGMVGSSLGHSTVAVPYVQHTIITVRDFAAADEVTVDTSGTNVGPYNGGGYLFIEYLGAS